MRVTINKPYSTPETARPQAKVFTTARFANTTVESTQPSEQLEQGTNTYFSIQEGKRKKVEFSDASTSTNETDGYEITPRPYTPIADHSDVNDVYTIRDEKKKIVFQQIDTKSQTDSKLTLAITSTDAFQSFGNTVDALWESRPLQDIRFLTTHQTKSYINTAIYTAAVFSVNYVTSAINSLTGAQDLSDDVPVSAPNSAIVAGLAIAGAGTLLAANAYHLYKLATSPHNPNITVDYPAVP